jgi:hypothetical protein
VPTSDVPPLDEPPEPPEPPDPATAPSQAGTPSASEPDVPREIVLPRGCNPLTCGVVMATLEMAVLLVLWQRCR